MLTLETKSLKGRITKKFNQWIRPFEKHLNLHPLSTTHLSSDSLRRRILQRVVELTYEAFSRAHMASGRASIISNSQFYNGVFISSSGKLKLKVVLRIKNILFFWLMFVFVVKTFFEEWARRRNEKRIGSATLMADIGSQHIWRNGSNNDFVYFCKNGPVDILRSASKLIIQTNGKGLNVDSLWFYSSRIPLVTLLVLNKVPIFHLFMIFINTFLIGVKFSFLAVINPAFSLLNRDLVLLPLARYLNDQNLIESYILSDTNWMAQYLYMGEFNSAKFKLHFIWHSQNTRCMSYKNDTVHFDYPHRRYSHMDEAWYWTKDFGSWLEDNNVKFSGHPVGPIMWRTTSDKISLEPRFKYISVFDVTPPSREWCDLFGWPYLYCNAEVCIKFLDDVLKVADELGDGVKVILKHKRSFSKIHDSKYIAHVAELEKNNPNFSILSHDIDPAQIVRACDLVVTFPYSSTAYVAASEGIKSIYYDAFDELVYPDFIEGENIEFVSGFEELRSTIKNALTLNS